MSREKQIDEMACDMCTVKLNCNSPYKPIPTCQAYKNAVNAYDYGYRKQEWISVDERLPKTRETILYFNGEWVDACSFDGDNFMTLDAYESDIIDGVTHWMPLPEDPKKGGAE